MAATGSLPDGASTEPLGAVGAAGLLILLLVVPGVALAPGRRRGGLIERLGPLSICALVAFVTATIGGLSALIANYLTSQVRVWERMSLLLAFLALAASAMTLDALTKRVHVLSGARRSRAALRGGPRGGLSRPDDWTASSRTTP